MKKMVGFRYTVVHQYTKVQTAIVEAVIAKDLDDLLEFAEQVRRDLDA